MRRGGCPMNTTSLSCIDTIDLTTWAGCAKSSERSGGAFEILRATREEDIDVLRGARTTVKRHCVAADQQELNRVAGEFLQQISEVGGEVHFRPASYASLR